MASERSASSSFHRIVATQTRSVIGPRAKAKVRKLSNDRGPSARIAAPQSWKANELYSREDAAGSQPRRAGKEPRRDRRDHRCDRQVIASHLLETRDQPAATYFLHGYWLVAATARRKSDDRPPAAFAIRMEYKGQERLTDLPLDEEIIGGLAMDAEIRGMRIGELVGALILEIVKKDFFQLVRDFRSLSAGSRGICDVAPLN